jgi:hypothetical protein
MVDCLAGKLEGPEFKPQYYWEKKENRTKFS